MIATDLFYYLTTTTLPLNLRPPLVIYLFPFVKPIIPESKGDHYQESSTSFSMIE